MYRLLDTVVISGEDSVLDTVVISGENVCCSVVFGTLVGVFCLVLCCQYVPWQFEVLCRVY